MSLYVMADLHLSSDRSKSMEVFGARWADYTEKIRKNWCAVVEDGDTVIVPGDISWGLKLEETADDFRFLEALPGEKIIGKGNHDFWWSTQKKTEEFWARIGVRSVRLLSNNAFFAGWRGDCRNARLVLGRGAAENRGGRRLPQNRQPRGHASADEPGCGSEAAEKGGTAGAIGVFLHFPPVFGGFVCREILDCLHEYGIRSCWFGHIHGAYSSPSAWTYEGITFRNCAADYLNFAPMPVCADSF